MSTAAVGACDEPADAVGNPVERAVNSPSTHRTPSIHFASKSSRVLPEARAATNQRGRLPMPDQLLPLLSRYLAALAGFLEEALPAGLPAALVMALRVRGPAPVRPRSAAVRP